MLELVLATWFLSVNSFDVELFQCYDVDIDNFVDVHLKGVKLIVSSFVSVI